MFAIGVRSIAKSHFWMLDTEPVHQRGDVKAQTTGINRRLGLFFAMLGL